MFLWDVSRSLLILSISVACRLTNFIIYKNFPLNFIDLTDKNIIGFHLKLGAAASYYFRKFFSPIDRESSTWRMTIPKTSSLFRFIITHGLFLERLIPKISMWLSIYVRYQWIELSGIKYSGRINLSIVSERVLSLETRRYIYVSFQSCFNPYVCLSDIPGELFHTLN